METVKGFKVFNKDFTCRDFQFEEGKEYTMSGNIKICNKGFHFCLQAVDCFNYYAFNPENIVCEVEALGDVQTHEDDSKACTNHIKIGRRLSWEEVLKLVNTGKGNTGMKNSGNSNSGNRNSGNSNSGNWNSGNWNSGYSNSGYRNSGNWNSGNSNSGNWNSGDSNSGYSNSGYRNSGDSNSGYSNSGNWNSGDSNSGYRNSGNWNSGDSNSGDSNSGYRNSGNWNSGDSNSGDSNSGYRNSGAFCADNNPKIFLFDKPSSMTVREWENSKAVAIMYEYLNLNIWVDASIMTDEEKKRFPKYETTGGYLKAIPLKDAWANMWGNLSDENKAVFTSLENFSWEIFTEITGIKVADSSTKVKKERRKKS